MKQNKSLSFKKSGRICVVLLLTSQDVISEDVYSDLIYHYFEAKRDEKWAVCKLQHLKNRSYCYKVVVQV